MWFLIGVSLLLALLVVLPKALHATGQRSVCPGCRYDLTGLEFTGTCPECGQPYNKSTVVRVGWELRWRVIPKILLLMVLPAAGPTLFLLVYAYLLERTYQWGWQNCWDQAAERDISYAPLMSLPLLLSSWLMMMHPRPVKAGASPFEDRIERSDFWRRFVILIPLGVVSVGSLGLVVWLHRRYFYDLVWMLPAFVSILGVLALAHFLLELAYRRRHPKTA